MSDVNTGELIILMPEKWRYCSIEHFVVALMPFNLKDAELEYKKCAAESQEGIYFSTFIEWLYDRKICASIKCHSWRLNE